MSRFVIYGFQEGCWYNDEAMSFVYMLVFFIDPMSVFDNDSYVFLTCKEHT